MKVVIHTPCVHFYNWLYKGAVTYATPKHNRYQCQALSIWITTFFKFVQFFTGSCISKGCPSLEIYYCHNVEVTQCSDTVNWELFVNCLTSIGFEFVVFVSPGEWSDPSQRIPTSKLNQSTSNLHIQIVCLGQHVPWMIVQIYLGGISWEIHVCYTSFVIIACYSIYWVEI